MANALKCLEEAEQEIKKLSEQKDVVEQTKIESEAHFKELQVCFEEQKGIIENLQKQQKNKNLGYVL